MDSYTQPSFAPARTHEAPHALFELIAEADPSLTAVEHRGERLTYGELEMWSGAIAGELRRRGVGPEAVVGICLRRTPAAIAAILGVHRAGGAYLPLDPAHPHERLRFMAEDAGAAVVIADEGLDLGLPVVDPAGLRQRTRAFGRSVVPDPGALAYVMYTSGSTGKPKGVMIEHRSLAAFVDWGLASFSREELSSVLASTSLGFDISIFEVFVPLAAGGRIVLEENLLALRGGTGEGVTLVNTVPSPMAALLADTTLPDSVETVILAGEPLSRELAMRVHEQPGVRRLVNAYGPTEDTIYSTCAEVSGGERPTIGRPLPGSHAHVVDEHMQPVPAGTAGELLLGGPKLARGYRNRPELTSERFIQNPLPGDGPERLYRTGDLASIEPDGTIAHLGRIDEQIKLRGIRIEPGEIEDALVRIDGVRQAAVVARAAPSGEKQLVAYVVPEGDPLVPRDLRAELRRALPEALVPAVVVSLESLPLNANGKLDRKALPAPAERVAPRSSDGLTGTERRLAGMWADLLGLRHLPGPADEFFELGGSSLIAFELFERIGRELGEELSPSVLVEAGTLRALARRVESGEGDSGRLVKIRPDGDRVPCMYVHAGAGGMLTLRRFSAALGEDQPVYGLQAFADDQIEVGRLVPVEATATECLEVLREVRPHGPYLLAGHSIGGHIAFEMACRLEAEGEEVAFLGLLDSAAPHTQRRAGRVKARVQELSGVGPERRRAALVRSVISALRARLRRSRGEAPPPVDPQATRPEDAAWMRNLGRVERRYRPPAFHGDAVVYTTEDGRRWTGSRTLGWHGHVDGSLRTCQVPGDHLTMLLEPNVRTLVEEMRGDLRAAQARLVRRGGR